jgi:hypothetical protein
VQPLKRYVDVGRHDFIAVAGRNHRVYAGYQYALRRHNRKAVVASDTDLCAEGPPGAGNTFFITGFAIANPGASIASHHHVFAQVERAVLFSIPLLLIVREPAACVLSRAVSFRDPIMVGPVYRQWLSFWQRAVNYVDDSVLIDFDTMTSVPARVIERLNMKFGTEFSSDFPSRDAVFAEMDRRRAEKNLPMDINPNRPDDRKREMRSYLRPFVENHRLARPAAALYQQVMERVAQHV